MKHVGQNVPHDSAHLHVTGKSTFIDDMPPLHGEVCVGIVPCPKAHAKILSIDTTAAKQIPGVLAILAAADIPGHNRFGPVVQDEYLLAEKEAVFIGHPLALIVAENKEALLAARKAVKFQLEELAPIFTIDDAIKASSFLGNQRLIQRGDVDKAFASAPHTLTGTFDIGGQEHFYLESQVALAVPGEDNTFTIHSSTQHPSEVQTLVAEILAVRFNHVTVICKRMGGGFGGKETQAAQPAMFAALAAHVTRRPARFVYSKDDDMRFTGKRHPFKAFYKTAFTDQGEILAVDTQLYSNGGCSTDLSFAVLERAMLHNDNAYFIPHFRVTGRVCKTNLPSNTAFRGFGGPQGVAAMENLIEEIAHTLKIDALDIRQTNCYGRRSEFPSPCNQGEGKGGGPIAGCVPPPPPSPGIPGEREITPYGQTIANNTLPRLFETLRKDSDYDRRRDEIDQFNQHSRTQLRGMSLTAVKFGISFTRRTLNQANALVNIYVDGSVVISTGATEMGQGVNTRIRQLAADELGLPLSSIRLMPTNTEKNNNTSPTAASSGTDLNGAAALDACQKLKGRLAPIAAKMLADQAGGLHAEPDHIRFLAGRVFDDRRPAKTIDFQQVICHAYELRINLGERGFYATPGVDFNRDTGKGHPFLYYTNGGACTEVLINRFTGEMKLARVDLLMDLGQSINPGIDRGQVTGAFIQGVGWVTTEELVYSAQGNLLSYSPTTYKIPNISDLPDVFNVSWIDNPDNHVSLLRSKSVGEPPLLLGISAFTAVKNALSYLGEESMKIALPATGERILLAMPARTAKPSTYVPAPAK
ncbi:MAG TPA: xanthine dehydrogenase molybdopterin binding subunit [Tepidisphaeraceae bacterium]|jgi:xanthine dehydrogenase large subunit